jgi:hypothetical protein
MAILGLEESLQDDLRGQITAVAMSKLRRKDQRQHEERDPQMLPIPLTRS